MKNAPLEWRDFNDQSRLRRVAGGPDYRAISNMMGDDFIARFRWGGGRKEKGEGEKRPFLRPGSWHSFECEIGSLGSKKASKRRTSGSVSAFGG